MENARTSSCQSVFSGGALTQERYTKLWINLINQIEKSKETVAVH